MAVGGAREGWVSGVLSSSFFISVFFGLFPLTFSLPPPFFPSPPPPIKLNDKNGLRRRRVGVEPRT